jgi:hypothetical protein
MTQRLFKKTEKTQKYIQSEKNVSSKNKVIICAGCGADNPEYILDERELCLDCYKAELEH